MIRYDNFKLSIKDHVLCTGSVEFNKGQFSIITGNSGCGKTTLLYSLAKFIENDVVYDDDIEIGFVFQDSTMFEELTILENMNYMRSLSHRKELYSLEECLEFVNLDIDINKTIHEISGGQRQRLAIASVLYKNVDYIFLDEPTSHLDNKNSQKICELLQYIAHTLHIGIIVATHDHRMSEYCDKIYHIEDKNISLIKDIEQPVIQKDIIKEKHHPMRLYIHDMLNHLKRKDYVYHTILVILLGFASLFLGYSYSFSYQENTLFQDISQNELRISYKKELDVQNYDSMYQDKIPLKDIDLINQSSYVNKVYPFYEMSATIDGHDIIIQSYYDSSILDKYTQTHITEDINCKINNVNSNSNGYIYFSNSLDSYIDKNQNITINLLKDDRSIIPINMKLHCNNLLEESYQNHYSKNGEQIIYIHYSLLDSIYSSYIKNNKSIYTPSMYLVSINDFDNFSDVITSIHHIDKDINIYSSFDLTQLMKLKDNMYHMRRSSLYLIMILVFVVSLYNSVSAFFYHIHEIALMRAQKLTLIQTVLSYLVPRFIVDSYYLLISLIIIVLGNTVFQLWSIQVLLMQLFVLLSYMLIQYLLLFIFQLIYLKTHSIQSLIKD